MRMRVAFGKRTYYRSHGVTVADLAQVSWQKSAYSNLNGSCVEIGRILSDRIGIRDTKDDGAGPVLVFTGPEWDAFIAGARSGEFDEI